MVLYPVRLDLEPITVGYVHEMPNLKLIFSGNVHVKPKKHRYDMTCDTTVNYLFIYIVLYILYILKLLFFVLLNSDNN